MKTDPNFCNGDCNQGRHCSCGIGMSEHRLHAVKRTGLFSAAVILAALIAFLFTL